MTRPASFVAIAAVTFVLALPAFAATDAVTSPTITSVRYPRCSARNRRYPHGVGRVGACDHTSGTSVTTFKHSNTIYRQNSHLDRDKDGVACEKA
jgi:hypothetical protein